jgi:hypothetical protein
MIFYPYSTPTLTQTQKLDHTQRGTGGFGSTDYPISIIATVTTDLVGIPSSTEPLLDTMMPYNSVLSNDPYDNTIQITVHNFGTHPTLGLVLQQEPHHQAPQLIDIVPNQPCSRIKKWRSTLKGTYITQIEHHQISTTQDIIDAFAQCRTDNINNITINFSIEKPFSGVQPTEGIPILFSDQLNVISQTLKSMKLAPQPTETSSTTQTEALKQQPSYTVAQHTIDHTYDENAPQSLTYIQTNTYWQPCQRMASSRIPPTRHV